MDKLWVKDVQVGQKAAGLFLVVRKQQLTGKNGKPYLKVTLQDKTGSLDARIWAGVEELSPKFEQNDLVQVAGAVEAFQGHPQLTVETLEKPTAEEMSGVDPNEFVLVSPVEPAAPRAGPVAAAAGGDAALEALRREFERVTDRHVKALLGSFLDDPEISSRLKRAPGAREVHHAYPGGLAEHLLSCVRLAQRMADHFPMADRDLLIAGAFLHDLGKVVEYDYDQGPTVYSDEGRLVGHLVLTAAWIHERAKIISGFPKELENHLMHLVVAHHGKLEHGSPRSPATLEAYLVHHVDEIDSRVNSFLAQMARGNPDERWTDPRKPWEQALFKGAVPTESGKRRGPSHRSFGRGRGLERKKRREIPAARPAGGDGAEARPDGARPEGARPEGARPEGAEGEARPPRPARERHERRERPEREAKGEPGAPRHERGERHDRGEKPGARKEEKLTFKPFAALAAEETPPPAEAAVEAAPGTAPGSAPEAAASDAAASDAAASETTAPAPAEAQAPAADPAPQTAGEPRVP